MKLKKLSIAAALSLGVMTISGLAIADQLSQVCPPPRAAMEQPCPIGAAAPVCPAPQLIPQEPCPAPCPTGAAIPMAPAMPIGAACPVCPTISQGFQHVYSPALMPAPAPTGAAMSCAPIGGCTPDYSAGAHIIERQAFAFPDIGDAGLIIPQGDSILQIGGDREAIAVGSTCPSSLSVIPSQGSTLTLMSKDDPVGITTGAAAPCAPWASSWAPNVTGFAACPTPVVPGLTQQGVIPPNYNPCAYPCPVNAEALDEDEAPFRVTQGAEILRCGIPEQNKLMQAYFNSPCFREAGVLGAAAPINPCPTAAPVAPFNPCSPCPTGTAAPIMPYTGGAAPIMPVAPVVDPYNQYIPNIPLSSAESNLVPCASTVEDKELTPCDAFEPVPTGAAAPVCPPAPKAVEPCPPPPSVCPEPCPAPCPAPVAAPVAAPCPTGFAAPMPAGRRLQTSSGIQMQKSVLVPIQVPGVAIEPTGAACPVMSQYPDVSNNMLAGCDINKLTAQGILAGYPDRTYKPNLPIMRDEFASAMVSALELENVPDFEQQIFKDVPKNHWANKDIDKAYNRGLLTGYPDNTFKPDRPVTRAEALSTMGKVIPGDIAAADAQRALGCFTDANEVPNWASSSVADAVNAGIIKDLPQNDRIKPNEAASRAEVASMLDNLRVKLGLEPCPVPQTTGAATQLVPGVATSTIPTIKMEFEDIISARTSKIGEGFVAKTVEPISIDGKLFPVGSEVHGNVVEVVRPGFGDPGAIRVAFDYIQYECGDTNDDFDGKYRTELPKDILSAVVVKEDEPNIIGRTLSVPFSLPGRVAGIAARTVGGTAIVAGNMVETFLTNTANGVNELASLEPAAAGRSFARAALDIPEGVWYAGKTAVSGTLGVVAVTGQDLAYIVSPDGERVAQINSDEVLSVAFAAK